MGTFSDEYDLYPRILQDVQRALKLKHRREARRKSGQLDGPVPAPGTGSLTTNRPSSPLRSTSAISTLTAPSTTDIDFSPSTGPSVVRVRVDPLRRLHPIPLSNDGGETLDWSGSGSKAEKSEKRWSLSVSRRGKEKEKEKDKERELLPTKLSRIKSASSQSTSKKVAITADQIGRRYNLIYTSFLTPGSTLLPNHQSDITTTSASASSASETDIKEFNLLKVSKWYSAQDPLVRSSLEKAEPFIWLKHLEKKRNLKQPKGEEGQKDKAGREEDNVKEDPTATTTTTRLPWHLSALIMEEYILAQSAKNHSHFPAFPVRNIPHLQPPHKPINPTPYAARSMHSFGLRKPRSTTTAAAMTNANESDDGNGYGSSARNSATEQSDNGGGDRREESFIHVESEEPETATPGASTAPAPGGLSPTGKAPRANTNTRNLRPLRSLRNRNRNSLPTTEEDRITLAIERKRKQEAEEAREDMEYELKAQLVASCKDSNAHIRSVLNHIAQHMREYEMCQARGGGGGFGYTAISPELFEAFSHDPANVTSSTKRLKTYRAVDDIHHRLTRQRAVFAEFLAQNKNSKDSHGGSDGPETQDIDILKSPIENLMRTLKKLEHHRLDVVNREKEVSEMLRETQVVHAEVKKEYNGTLAHTSVVYPELSQIVALEESYKDQYQHLWDIGMDALTFILDSVTPFWRSYGKLIGDDVQDFLIVPLYRNEYTGEAKRYPIPRLPVRSFRHWGGLFGFFAVSVGVVVLQARAAVGCVGNYRLEGWLEEGGLRWVRWGVLIPVFWVGILVQWLAVIGEAAVVLMQVGTVMWWVGWLVGVFD
ncbi:hypothetical protein F5051DRAFT_480309 [Lentinula edodes]|nr:hypothetical protein F5051DRAFT_480309 [Lentinula edodes]